MRIETQLIKEDLAYQHAAPHSESWEFCSYVVPGDLPLLHGLVIQQNCEVLRTKSNNCTTKAHAMGTLVTLLRPRRPSHITLTELFPLSSKRSWLQLPLQIL